MRKKFSDLVEKGRVLDGQFGTEPGSSWGVFMLKSKPTGNRLKIIASSEEVWHMEKMEGTPWEHVSVSCVNGCPLWNDMAWVKDLFFEDEELVVQYHPPKSQYVNVHSHCLHLWRIVGVTIPQPPVELV